MASACSSSVSVQKSSCATSSTCTPSNGNRKSPRDNVCSSTTSCYLQKKRPTHPLAASIRPIVKHETNIRQRVRSAKMIKMRSLQSQLNDANYHLMELAQENRALKTLQRRQDKALKTYEGVNADLPRLIQAHEEENRVMTEKNKAFKRSVRELTEQLKLKDEELISVKDQLKHLMDLAKDKNLEEREKLTEYLEEARQTNRDYEQQISILNRKLILEVKSCKYKLNAEMMKNKRCQQELSEALHKVDVPEGNKESRLSRRRTDASPLFKKSQINLSATNSQAGQEVDVKLEPINKRASSTSSRTSLTSPAEKIKARLSSGVGGGGVKNNTDDVADLLGKLQMEEDQLKKSLRNGIRNPKLKSTKLETLVAAKSIEKSEETTNSSSFMDAINANGLESDVEDVVDSHIQKLEESKAKIERTEAELKSLQGIEDHLLQADPTIKDIILKESDYDLVNEIWSEEYSFRKTQRDKNGNLPLNRKDPIVALENKQKLLAALKDIDNGKGGVQEDDGVVSIENNVDTGARKSRLMKELFG